VSRARASIGYVFQSFLLLAGLTAIDNVLLAARYIGRDATTPAGMPSGSWSAWASPTGPRIFPRSSRAASSSASPIAAPC